MSQTVWLVRSCRPVRTGMMRGRGWTGLSGLSDHLPPAVQTGSRYMTEIYFYGLGMSPPPGQVWNNFPLTRVQTVEI